MRANRFGGVLAIVAIALLFTGGEAMARVYKWTDAQGKVHYTASPPPAGQTGQVVKVPESSPSDSGAAAEAPAAKPAADGATKADDGQEARREALKKNCEIARKNLSLLRDPTRRRFTLKEGEAPVFITDEQRAELIQKGEQDEKEFCIEGASEKKN